MFQGGGKFLEALQLLGAKHLSRFIRKKLFEIEEGLITLITYQRSL
jgi:hypothetical protein